MRKLRSYLSIILIIFIFTSCRANNKPSEVKENLNNNETTNTNEPINTNDATKTNTTAKSNGITVNKINFSSVAVKDVPEGLKATIETQKFKKGFIYKTIGEEIYIAVFAGLKPTKAHNIKVLSVEDNEGITIVTVEEIKPNKGEIAQPDDAYPYVVIKAKGITPRINVQSTAGDKYLNIGN